LSKGQDDTVNPGAPGGLLRVAHKTITLVQPRAFPFAGTPFVEPGTSRDAR